MFNNLILLWDVDVDGHRCLTEETFVRAFDELTDERKEELGPEGLARCIALDRIDNIKDTNLWLQTKVQMVCKDAIRLDCNGGPKFYLAYDNLSEVADLFEMIGKPAMAAQIWGTFHQQRMEESK